MTVWLVVNVNSGSYDADRCEALSEAFRQGGRDFGRLVRFPEEDLPTVRDLDDARVETLAIYTGDGTINSLAKSLKGWRGALLILPGGTMNLLSRRLHGDEEPEDIIARFCAGAGERRRIPVVSGAGEDGLVGVIAGPTTAWGEVRESMRHLDVGKLVEKVPAAWSETFQGTPVMLEGTPGAFPAIYLEPHEDGIEATGFTAEGVGQIVAHGFAWLGGDFRTGPHEKLGVVAEAVIAREGQDGSAIGLLVDGEQADATGPCRFTLERSGVEFVATA